jgi:c-di-GMP-binding flagellar brake protein YcgR
MKDRRRDVRVIEENRVVLSLMTGDVRPGAPAVFYSLTRDISLGGVRIMTAAALEAGGRVLLDITLSRSRKRIRSVAQVRWVRELYAGEVYEAGLEFVGLDPSSELVLMDHIFGGKDGSSA